MKEFFHSSLYLESSSVEQGSWRVVLPSTYVSPHSSSALILDASSYGLFLPPHVIFDVSQFLITFGPMLAPALPFLQGPKLKGISTSPLESWLWRSFVSSKMRLASRIWPLAGPSAFPF